MIGSGYYGLSETLATFAKLRRAGVRAALRCWRSFQTTHRDRPIRHRTVRGAGRDAPYFPAIFAGCLPDPWFDPFGKYLNMLVTH